MSNIYVGACLRHLCFMKVIFSFYKEAGLQPTKFNPCVEASNQKHTSRLTLTLITKFNLPAPNEYIP